MHQQLKLQMKEMPVFITYIYVPMYKHVCINVSPIF